MWFFYQSEGPLLAGQVYCIHFQSFVSLRSILFSLSLIPFLWGKEKAKKFGKYLSTCFSPGRVCNWLIHRSTTGVLKYFTSWRQTKLNFSILAFMGLSIFRLGYYLLVTDAQLNQLCSLFKHCSKRLWPTHPFLFLLFFFDGLGGNLHCSKIGQYKA